MKPILLSSLTAASCIGTGLEATRASLRAGRSGLVPCRFEDATLPCWIGEVAGLDQVTLPADLVRFDCRNNRLAQLALAQDGFAEAVAAAAGRHGRERVGVLLGTSTAGILTTEHAYRRRDAGSGALPADFDYRGTHNIHSVSDFVRQACALEGPALAVSSACSSSAKVFATAARMIEVGLIDAAVVGGVDSLCLTTLYGFNSLELLSPEPCRPFDAGRRGISIGEAAAFVLLERAPDVVSNEAIVLRGYGESSDAHHMSSPHPEGLGARLAMEAALARADLAPTDIDYINLHGTATPSNDSAEGRAVADLFGRTVPASSTKGYTGHALGAAGGLEAVIAAIALQDGAIPGSAGTRTADPAIGIDYVLTPRSRPIVHVLSNSFGFGGTNASLILSRGSR
ncbi:MAG: beta-ketoacyl-[acyl-carrier-protein] synthase family protein [Rhodocyclaceae bacterium]|nr:beta-ketoacyl-[acyl-carrier-protein] synthase family protein [Rhodocyclaceae bacterium]